VSPWNEVAEGVFQRRYDHCFGNHRFGPGTDVGAPIYGHERVPAHLTEFEEPMLARWIAQGREPAADWREVITTPPTELVGDHAVLDLGERRVELVHLGRGHTDNDLLVHVPDATTWLAGDLVEQSGPPAYGSDCFPLDWPDTVGALRVRLVDDTIVPGHGGVVGPAFVADQHAALYAVADLIRELHAAGIAAVDAWPRVARAGRSRRRA
jgi:glyoxylase-like metal-dependent hydrolase (beta-lactamase superfamily II)